MLKALTTQVLKKHFLKQVEEFVKIASFTLKRFEKM